MRISDGRTGKPEIDIGLVDKTYFFIALRRTMGYLYLAPEPAADGPLDNLRQQFAQAPFEKATLRLLLCEA